VILPVVAPAGDAVAKYAVISGDFIAKYAVIGGNYIAKVRCSDSELPFLDKNRTISETNMSS
jgi:hypothetical protein